MRATASILLATRDNFDKRRTEIRRRAREHIIGPQGESRSEAIQHVEIIELRQIRDDPDFHNIRLQANEENLSQLTDSQEDLIDLQNAPDTHNIRLQANEEKLTQLADSMSREGLKVPIVVIATSDPEPRYYVRAGFRRLEAARRLRWKRLPAIILPHDTPVIDEYWTNIIENSSRSNLSTYEVACAARSMRDKFGIQPKEFALRAGYSDSYVDNLLRCITKLPAEIKEEWKNGAPIPVDFYVKWAGMQPKEAIREMLSYCNRHPKIARNWSPPSKVREKAHPIKMASAVGLSRMQRLRFATEVAREIEEKERTLCLQVIDYCSGARNDVPGIFESDKKKHAYQSRRREDLPPPENVAEAAALATKPPKDD